MNLWSWQITAAAQPGTSHLRRGEGCADAFGAAVYGSAVVLSIADGAGSARYGAVGSAAAADIAVRIAAAKLDEIASAEDGPNPCCIVRDVFKCTLEILSEAAARAEHLLSQAEAASPPELSEDFVHNYAVAIADGIRRLSGPDLPESGAFELRDLHTTLLLAILTERGLSAGNIGDGWLVVSRSDGEMRVVAPPAQAEYANETFFLDSAGALDDAVYEHTAGTDISALALMTDGPARFAIEMSSRKPGASLLEKLFAFAADGNIPRKDRESQLAAFLGSGRICRCTDDDKTILLAARVPAGVRV